MKKSYKIENLDCASCAAKMERAIKNIHGVNDANISFLMQKLTIDIEEESKVASIMSQASDVCKKIESGCKILL